MKKLIVATIIAFALSTPALAFDLGGIDGISSDIKDAIAQQSGGRITNRQVAAQQQGAGQEGQQRGGRQARQSRKGQSQQGMQAQMMQRMQSMMDGDSDLGSAGSFMGR